MRLPGFQLFPKPGDLTLAPFNIFLDPEVQLVVQPPTETPCTWMLALVRSMLTLTLALTPT